MTDTLHSFPRKRESRTAIQGSVHSLWFPAFRLRAMRFGGLKPAEACEASEGRAAGMSG